MKLISKFYLSFSYSRRSNEEKTTKGSNEESSKPETSTKSGSKASNEEGSPEKEKPTTLNPENSDSKPAPIVDDGPWFINPPTGAPDSIQVFNGKTKPKLFLI
jgi:hypothetical protein